MRATAVRPFLLVLLGALLTALLAQGFPAVAGLVNPPAPTPLPEVVVLARADNPVDALAASSVAGQLGASVLLTPSNVLDGAAREELQRLRPDLVVLAGGTAAISDAVLAEVQALGLTVRRVSGAGRTQTAAALSQLASELGIGRPVLTGAQVEGDAYLGGRLTVDELAVQSGALVENLRAATADDATALGGRPASTFVAPAGTEPHAWRGALMSAGVTTTIASVEVDSPDPCGDGTTRNRYLVTAGDVPALFVNVGNSQVHRQIVVDRTTFAGPPGDFDHEPINDLRGGTLTILGGAGASAVENLRAELYVDDVDPGPHTFRYLGRHDHNGRVFHATLTVLHLGWECGGTPAYPTPGT